MVGEPITDSAGHFLRLLPASEGTYQCLCYVAPHGLTIFNALQMPVVLTEWQRLALDVQTVEEQDFMSQVERLMLNLLQKSRDTPLLRRSMAESAVTRERAVRLNDGPDIYFWNSSQHLWFEGE